ncbi:tRNA synthetases class I (M)-domain-containing protein [Ochromonadaceae sp. CCMP2298]|nr:tRNA synthetases class I (M)-domain-containing protein [Ochromonadaceae sp. CCMP2298]|mmetsp:Transcript_7901/g.17217  ORF Transcript_7901/g.17217 Transcript_7901/m.17217 type:complete len:737 (-) Transcript_7901:233-2443(-)
MDSEHTTDSEFGALATNLPDHREETYYLTTAISYTNGNPHIGHAYEFITADALVRYHRVLGYDTYFVTGTDEHGQKVAASAQKAGLEPLVHCDGYVAAFKDLDRQLLINYSDFVRTTDPGHELTSQTLWKMCASAGDIYLDAYEGWYNEREEVFVTQADAEAAEFKDVGSGLPLKRVKEESYFFRMSKYTDRLLEYIALNPSFIEPEAYRNNIVARLTKDPLRDLSISRTSFAWGIPVPEGFDQRHVMYVWFDALSNYLTGVNGLGVAERPAAPGGQANGHALSDYWPAAKHIIGKDIIWFHCVIWPCMLMSAGLPLPRGVYSHGFVNASDGRKMSKSYNNTIDPKDILAKYPVDTIRYYTCAAATYGSDMNFSEESLVQMHNSELADVLGNLVHRVFTLAHKYCAGEVPDVQHDGGLPFDLGVLKEGVIADMTECALHLALFKAMEAVRATNRFLSEAEPWKMKGADEHRRVAIVRTALEAIYAFCHFLAPVMPLCTQQIFSWLGTGPVSAHNLREDMYNLAPGTAVGMGEILFKKIEVEAVEAPAAAAGAGGGVKGKKTVEVEEEHELDFTKADLRVGRVVRVWHHETAERLFCEEIDLGASGVRVVVSGLRAFYSLEDLQDRLVVVVANLKESKFQGVLSAGMVLAAKSADGLRVELLSVPEGSAVGERVFLSGGMPAPAALTAARMKKLKAWEGIVPDLHTDEAGVACWRQSQLATSAGVCRVATLVDVPIS